MVAMCALQENHPVARVQFTIIANTQERTIMFNDRNQLRQTFIDAYKKHKNSEPLNSLEQLLVKIIIMHPEYNNELENPDTNKDFTTDNNPYLHLALHVSLEEQLATNRPAGIIPTKALVISSNCSSVAPIFPKKGVGNAPGERTLTRIPFETSSSAEKVLANVRTAPLAAEYTENIYGMCPPGCKIYTLILRF